MISKSHFQPVFLSKREKNLRSREEEKQQRIERGGTPGGHPVQPPTPRSFAESRSSPLQRSQQTLSRMPRHWKKETERPVVKRGSRQHCDRHKCESVTERLNFVPVSTGMLQWPQCEKLKSLFSMPLPLRTITKQTVVSPRTTCVQVAAWFSPGAKLYLCTAFRRVFFLSASFS